MAVGGKVLLTAVDDDELNPDGLYSVHSHWCPGAGRAGKARPGPLMPRASSPASRRPIFAPTFTFSANTPSVSCGESCLCPNFAFANSAVRFVMYQFKSLRVLSLLIHVRSSYTRILLHVLQYPI